MRIGITICAGVVLATGVTAAKASPAARLNEPAAPRHSAQGEAAETKLASGAALNATLSSSVDSKKAKVGDKVEARMTEDLKNGDRTVIPNGTKLLGHVTQATARVKGDDQSSLAIQFDNAVPKKGAEIPLHVMVMAVAAPDNDFDGGRPSPGLDPMADRGAAAAGGSPMGASRPQPPPTPGLNGANLPPGDDAGSANGVPRGPLPAKSRGVYGLSGLQLMMEGSQVNPNQTMITSGGKDVRLDSGTRLLLVVEASAPSKASP